MSVPASSSPLPLLSVLTAGILWGIISLFIRPLSQIGLTMG